LSDRQYELSPIGWVESPLLDPEAAPKQGNEGAPDAWLILDERFSEGLRDLEVGAEVLVLTWLDRARRDVLVVHPRDNPANPLTGVFSTRSADRPIQSASIVCRFSSYRALESVSEIWRRSTEHRSST